MVLILAFAALDLLGFLLMSRQRKPTIWHLALRIVGPILVVVLPGCVTFPKQKAALVALEPHVDDYLSLPGTGRRHSYLQLNSALFTRQAAAPYIRDKVLPVRIRDKSADMLYHRPPDELQAAMQEELGTVV